MPTTHNLDDHVAVPDVPARTRVQQVEVVEDDGASRDEEQRFVGVTGVGPEGECRLDARGVGDSHHVDAALLVEDEGNRDVVDSEQDEDEWLSSRRIRPARACHPGSRPPALRAHERATY